MEEREGERGKRKMIKSIRFVYMYMYAFVYVHVLYKAVNCFCEVKCTLYMYINDIFIQHVAAK